MFSRNLCHIKCWLTDQNSGNTTKSPLSWWNSGKHSPKPTGNRLAGEKGRGKMSIKGGLFKKEMFNIDTCNITFPIPYFYASTKEVNTVLEAISIWLSVWYISDTSQYRCTISNLPLFYIYFIYIHTHQKKGKTVNDIVSTKRIMSTKLTFRAILPFQILSTCRKERKKPNTFFILVFSSLVPHLFYSFIYFFLLLHAWS